MLKIKDDVDLKELEKFGIKKGYRIHGVISQDTEYEVMSIDEKRIITVARDLWWSKNYYYGFVTPKSKKGGEDILFDLIQADLVEKVGHNNG